MCNDVKNSVQKRPCKPSRSILLQQWHVCAAQMLAPRRKPIEIGLQFEAAYHQVSGLESCKEQNRLCLDEGKNFRTFVNHSRNQILSGFDVDRLCPVFLGLIERIFLFICKFQPLFKRFKKAFSNVSEKIVVRKALAPKVEAKKSGSANNDANEIPTPPISTSRAS